MEMRKRKEAMQRGCLAVFIIYDKFLHQSACGPLSVRHSKRPLTVSLVCERARFLGVLSVNIAIGLTEGTGTSWINSS